MWHKNKKLRKEAESRKERVAKRSANNGVVARRCAASSLISFGGYVVDRNVHQPGASSKVSQGESGSRASIRGHAPEMLDLLPKLPIPSVTFHFSEKAPNALGTSKPGTSGRSVYLEGSVSAASLSLGR